jgi:TPR repeat protein
LEYLGAARNDPWRLYFLASIYKKGFLVNQDLDQSIDYVQKSANLGYAPAQNKFGWAIYKGDVSPKDPKTAISWIMKSAEQGFPPAYASLCEIYGTGGEIESDPNKTYRWCKLAVENLPDGRLKTASSAIFDLNKREMGTLFILYNEYVGKGVYPSLDHRIHMSLFDAD